MRTSHLLAFVATVYVTLSDAKCIHVNQADDSGEQLRMLETFDVDTETKVLLRSLFGRVDQLESTVKNQNKIIKKHEWMLHEYEQMIEKHEQTIYTHERTIYKYGQAIARHEQTIAKYERTISKHEQIIANHEQTIAKQEREIAKHERTIAKHEHTIDIHEQTIGKHDETIGKHEEIFGTHGQTIDKHEQTIDTFEQSIEELDSHTASSTRQTKNVNWKTDVAKTLDEEKPANHSFLVLEIERQATIQRGIREAPHVAFSAYLSHGMTHITANQVIKFDHVITNDGNAYNLHSGMFTVPVTGTYMFIFYCSTSEGQAEFQLMADDIVEASGISRPSQSGTSKDVQGGGAVILHLNQGVAVWIQNWRHYESTVFSTSEFRWVSFSGFLLY